MKKSLTALAVMAAVSVPFAAAQAESNFYGKMHMSVDYVDNKGDLSGADAVHVSTNSSRLGFKGSSDLGSGMKAIYQIEGNVIVGNQLDGKGVGDIGGRNTYAGLGTPAGTILLGKHDVPVKTIGRKIDMFGDQIGDSRNLITHGTQADARPGEVAVYVSPSIAGAQLAVASNMGTGTADQAFGLISASGTYKMGKDLYAAAGYQMTSSDVTGGAETESVIRAGAKYNMGAISVAALFQMTTAAGGTDANDRMAYGVGASYKMGKTKFKGQYYGVTAPDADDTSTGGLIAVGADQKLGDKTSAYVAFAMGLNGDTGGFTVSGGGHDSGKDTRTVAAGDSPMGLSLGIVHKF